MTALPFTRAAMTSELRRRALTREPFDVLVIGGGITGAGVALDAASRGLTTALVERDDFASGTSSKSSKMVHGGLRYLQNGDIRLVYEALHERRRLMRNAPHLVHVLPFMIPILTRDGVVSKRIARALGSAMWMYDVTGGWRIGRLHRRLSSASAAEFFPTTDPDRLSAGYLYYDAAADDARLTLTIARTAAVHGAVIANRCPVTGIEHDDSGRAESVSIEVDGEILDVPARAIVNAAGVWSDEVRAIDDERCRTSIRPAKGTHLVVPWDRIRNPVAVIIPVRRDRRSLSLTPWGPNGDGTFRHTYVGTTDTDYEGPLDDPRCDTDDIDYMLEALAEALVEPIGRDEITGVWAGLRPLVAAEPDGDGPNTEVTVPAGKTADLSRRHVVTVSASGIVSVNGGKLTTYREMAEDTVDRVQRELEASPGHVDASTRVGRGLRRWFRTRRSGGPLRRDSIRRHPTRRLRLLGARGLATAPAGSVDAHLIGRYGSLAPEIKLLIALEPRLGDALVEGQPYVRAEAIHAVRHEMATTLDDVLLRRTRAHLFDRAATATAAPAVADLIAAELGWDADERRRQLDTYRALCARELEAASDHLAHTTD
ncbi:MAG: glycerol-3-phosphate dehydrogenase/oxidase [Acidimicrobiia bacterium]|nr:glycerol-3-phosphate dehydrogenase/oxidase [Acidimicrobiia bacterium]